MNENTLSTFEKVFKKYKSNFNQKIRTFFESNFERLNDESTSKEDKKNLIDEFCNKPFHFGLLNYVSLVQAIAHLSKNKKTHEFDDFKICKICGIGMREQYEYKKFNTWHFDDGERIHRVK